MLTFEVQEQIREALRSVDVALASLISVEATVRKQAHEFRDYLFSAFVFIENESLKYQEIQVQTKRIDNNQLQVRASKESMPFLLYLDPEVAYDGKPSIDGSEGESVRAELAARLFVLFAPPAQGIVRTYTIFGDGVWKRTTFGLSQGRVVGYHTTVPRFHEELVMREAVDLLGYICMMRPTWDSLSGRAETMTSDMVHDRSQVKIHLTGLGAPRPVSKK